MKLADSEKIEKQKYHWDRVKEFPIISIQTYLKQVLEKFYPNISDKAEILDFISQWNILGKPIWKIERLSVDHIKEHFNDADRKALIINIGMGGGKTQNTIEFLKKEQDSFCWITPNISLTDNTHKRMQDLQISCSIAGYGILYFLVVILLILSFIA